MSLPEFDFGKISETLGGFDFTAPSWDLFILIFFVVAVFIYGFSLGRNRIVVILIAIYMALAVVNTAPFIDKWVERAISIDIGQVFAFKLGLFLIVFALLFFLFSRSTLLHSVSGNERRGSWWQIPIFSILHIGLLLSIALSFLPADALWSLSPFTREVFTSDIGKFVWITLPIGAMIILPE
ncbi:hypothetical protein KJ885_04515 [Patescibacteria group bacterium]|nr:hypothetical protein [Patescibacteria group bacterium]